jgi:hypothetical protein
LPDLNNNSSPSELLVHAAEYCLALAMRLFPQRHRFKLAVFLAHITVPLFRLTSAYREQEMKGFDGPNEIALHFILNALTRKGTQFDPVIEVKNYEEFESAYSIGKGVLVIGPHAALTLLMIRFFHDRGLKPIVIAPDPSMRVGGTVTTARTINPSATFLVRTMNRLRHGELICAMPDRAEHHGDRTVEFDTANGRVIVAPALMQVAARCGAKVIFTEVHLEGRRLVATIAPASPAAADADVVVGDFIEFVRVRAESRFALTESFSRQ